ncbi:melanization protease 1-like [Drosophila serrata]|uniref:melanization protease 1-like n=1 Tax=Drosophila serrata TaxID=7274 RepID=UPI000A1D2D28|nr:melanization protease 1-like [Drosophila serrata]
MFLILIFSILFLVQQATLELTAEAEIWVWNELRQHDCGTVSPKVEPRRRMLGVVGGRRVPVMSRPSMALLFLDDAMEHCRCGGSLITKRFVLTAAHCLVMCPRRNEIKVRLGEHTLTTSQDCSVVRGQRICAPPVENFNVEKIILHEEFSFFKQINDIALLQLSQNVIPNIHIRPICLPLTPDLLVHTSILGQSYIATGWGYMDQGQLSDALLEISIKSYQCPSRYVNQSILCSNGHIQDTCKGDSGGPLLSKTSFFGSDRYVQFGVISHGSWTCGQGAGAYFTKVPPFMPWIIKKIAIYFMENPIEQLRAIERLLLPGQPE